MARLAGGRRRVRRGDGDAGARPGDDRAGPRRHRRPGPPRSSTRPATRPTRRATVYERAFGEWMKTDPRATVGDLEALAAWDGPARLGAITAPVVVVVGEHEDADARAAAEALAGGRRRRPGRRARRGRSARRRRAAGGARRLVADRRRGGGGMTLSGAVAVAGVYEHPTRWAPDKTEFQIMAESAKGALDDAGLTIGDVDALFAASMTMSGMGIVDLAEYLDLKPTLPRRHEHRRLVVRRPRRPRRGGDPRRACARSPSSCTAARRRRTRWPSAPAWAASAAIRPRRSAAPYGMTTVGSYALVAQLHQQRFGTTSEQLAEIAVTMRHHAVAEPGGQDAPADHRRRRARQPHDLRAAAPARLLHHQRRRRRGRRDVGRAGARPARRRRCCCSAAASRWPTRRSAAGPADDRGPPVGRARRSAWPASPTTTSTCA